MRLTRKYAEEIDGINLVGREVGERLPLPPRDAQLLIAEKWAEPVPPGERRRRDLIRAATDTERHDRSA